MNWQPTLSWKDAKLRASILFKIRSFFHDKDIVEVETPLMSQGTVTDVHIDAFETRYNYFPESHSDSATQTYLQTSPEFAMKRLLAFGYSSIYQLCKAFRHEEHGRFHNPEFTLLEWYRLGFTHFDLMDEVDELLREILNTQQGIKVTYESLFLKYVNLNPLEATRDEIINSIVKRDNDVSWLSDNDDNDILLQYCFSEFIEPNIGKEVPTYVYNFPASQASLARICPQDNRVSQRFECYFRGIELANGFNELDDVEEQYSRFKMDNEQRRLLNKAVKPIDARFISALETGLPKCSGVALGVDRLVMLALGINDIKQVLTFDVARA